MNSKYAEDVTFLGEVGPRVIWKSKGAYPGKWNYWGYDADEPNEQLRNHHFANQTDAENFLHGRPYAEYT